MLTLEVSLWRLILVKLEWQLNLNVRINVDLEGFACIGISLRLLIFEWAFEICRRFYLYTLQFVEL